MEFYRYISAFQHFKAAKQGYKPKDFYAMLIADLAQGVNSRNHGKVTAFNQSMAEMEWYRDRCPYYNVYPGIVEPLLRFRLDTPIRSVILPLPTLVLRFADRGPLAFDGHRIKSVLVKESIDIPHTELLKSLEGQYKLPEKYNDRDPTLTMWMDFGEEENGLVVYTYRRLPKKEDMTVAASMAALPRHETADSGLKIPVNVIDDVVKIVVACCLISQDPSDNLLTPDILSKDRRKWENATEEERKRLVDRANRRRNSIGWEVGRQFGDGKEVQPFWRNAHLMLAWTGKGRTIPKLVMRKGHFVGADKIAKMPSGYGDT